MGLPDNRSVRNSKECMAESGEAVSESRAMARESCPIKLNELGEEGWELVAVT